LNNFAIIFTFEKTQYAGDKSSVLLAASIKNTMPDVDVYCGLFTNNTPDTPILENLTKLGVNIVSAIQDFPGKSPMNMFLRSYAKYYFANDLLDKYDYLVYIDVDALFLKPLVFDFDPTQPFVLVDKMPDWVKRFESTYTHLPNENIYYNWIDIINQHNKHLYDLDYKDPNIQFEKTSDIIVSRRINESNLPKIQQTIGAYHCLHPLTEDSQVIHYDSFEDDGSFINLKYTHPDKYSRYSILLEKVLNVKVTNVEGIWEARMRKFS
jgi:hypothetical protein